MSEAAYARYWAASLSMERHLDGLIEVYETAQREVAAGVPAVASLAAVPAAATPTA
jgi:hypothetical protein